MKEFKVVKEMNIPNLSDEINKSLAEGWELKGEIFRIDDIAWAYCMVKNNKPKKEPTSFSDYSIDSFYKDHRKFIHEIVLRNELYYGEAFMDDDDESLTDRQLELDILISEIYISNGEENDYDEICLCIKYKVVCNGLYEDTREDCLTGESDSPINIIKTDHFIKFINDDSFSFVSGKAKFNYKIELEESK